MEENFPRGGVKTAKRVSSSTENEDPNLFESKVNKKKRTDVKSKIKPKVKSKSHQDVAPDIQMLNARMLTSGMAVLGCVREVKDYEVTLTLPGGLQGVVSITDISDAYREQLKVLTQNPQSHDDDDDDMDVAVLGDLFKVGHVMPCQVMETITMATPSTRQNKAVKVSVNPKVINKGLTVTRIHNGMLLHGTVSSTEDHGYMVDIGVAGLHGFLRNNEAEKYIQMSNEGYPLKVGKPLMCCVMTDTDRMDRLTGSVRSINLTLSPDKVKDTQLKETHEITLDTMTPGMKLKVKVEKTHGLGVIVRFKKFKGSIHMSHLPMSPKNYTYGQQIDAVMLFINSTTKKVSFSALPHLVTYTGTPVSGQSGSYRVGDIISEAIVRKSVAHEKTQTVYFNLGIPMIGFAGNKNISDTKLDNQTFQENFSKGSVHKCRIVNYNLLDSIAYVTLKESIISQAVYSINNVEPGQLLQCTVVCVGEKSIKVSITKKIHGMISYLHSADVPLLHPEKKLKDKQTLTCRVLDVDKNRNGVYLTHKKSLVNSKLPILTSYDQLKAGLVTEGVIGSIKDNGVVVFFYGRMKGWVSLRECSTERIELPSKVFYKGQVVKCRVLNWSEEDNQISLSFNIGLQTSFGSKAVATPTDYKIGANVECKVQSVTDKGLNVTLTHSLIDAFIPKLHLSDAHDNWPPLMESYRKGTSLNALYYSKTNAITLTLRKCFQEFVEDEDVISDTEHLQPGMMIPGTVKNIVDYGIFVELIGGLVGLVPMKYASDKRVPTISSVFQKQQPVVAKVIEVDNDKKRFLLSLRMTECYHGNTDIGLRLLKHFLDERDHAVITTSTKEEKKKKTPSKSITKYKIGQVVTVTVTQTTDKGILCHTDDNVKGFAIHDHLTGVTAARGNLYEALVIFVDLQEKCLEFSLNASLVNAVKNRTEKFGKSNVGRVLKCETILIKPSFILGALKSHGTGQLVYIPSKRHLNDVLEAFQFEVKQINPVVVKGFHNGRVLCSLQVHEKSTTKVNTTLAKDYLKKSMTVNSTVTARIQKIFPMQMNLLLDNKQPARVHATQVKHTISNGEQVFQNYEEDTELSVTIIGNRTFNNKHNLQRKNHIPECSLCSEVKIEDTSIPVDKRYKIGDKLPVFVTHYKKNLLWVAVTTTVTGKIHLLNLSTDKQILSDPGEHFKEGQAYNATVMDIDKSGVLELSLVDLEKLKVGSEVQGQIVTVKHRKGLTPTTTFWVHRNSWHNRH